MRLAAPILIALSLTAASAAAQQKQLAESDFTSARQCGACHQEIYEQWSTSMHSRAATDSVYRYVVSQALEQTEGRLKSFCLPCHLPIASVTGGLEHISAPIDWESFSPLALEGVSCGFCHTASSEENLSKKMVPGFLVLRRTGSTEVIYGRHADASGNHHPVQSSRFLISAQFCAACHSYKHPVSGEEVQNTYREWEQSPYAKEGKRCQDCHMPPYSGSTAVGAPKREQIHAHVFRGGHSELIRQAATLSLEAHSDGEGDNRRLGVDAVLTNSGAGHSIPTGLPGIREMWLEVEVLDGDQLISRSSFPLGARLLKADGALALPWEAYEKIDNRLLLPGESRRISFEVPLSGSVRGLLRVRASLFMRRLPESLSNRLGLPVSVPSLMTRQERQVEIE